MEALWGDIIKPSQIYKDHKKQQQVDAWVQLGKHVCFVAA